MSNRSVNRAGLLAGKMIIVLLAASLGGLACPITTETAEIRAVHLSLDAPAVDVWQRDPDRRLFTNLNFADGTGYRSIDEGTRTFEISPQGQTIGDSVLTIEDLVLDGNQNYTAVVFGPASDLRALALLDDVTRPANDGIRLRVIHTAPDVGEVDVWNVTDPEAPVPMVENLSYGSAGENLVVPAGVYVVGIDVDGDEQPDLVFEFPELTSGTIANVFAVQDEEGNPFLLPMFLDGTTARVEARPHVPDLEDTQAGLRLVHLSPDAPAVDIWGPTATLVTGLEFAEGTDHLAVPANVNLVEIVPAGQGRENAVITIENPGLTAGQFYTAVVYGELEEISVLLLTDDLAASGPGNIKLRPVHAAVGVGAVDLWAARPDQAPALAYENLSYGTAGTYIEVPAGHYSVGLDVGRDGLINVTANLGDVTAATIANVYAVLDADGEVFFLIQENGRHTRVDAAFQDPPGTPGEILPLNE